ncbi:MAG: hypothetical protein QXT45_03105, partial [Candidatus Bilamarchaeaceae archaeon]
GEIENVLILGECPNEPGSVAAFGAQGSSVVVTPKYRIDMGKNRFEANLPAVSDELCPPPEIDNLPISRFEDYVNKVTKGAIVGTVSSRAEFSFITAPIVPKIIVDGSETSSILTPLEESDYALKAIAIELRNSALGMSSRIYSTSGEIVKQLELQGNIENASSKLLKIFQVSQANKILPTINWMLPPAEGPAGSIKMCLRSADGTPKETPLVITGDVVGVVDDTCADKIFAAFELANLNAVIEQFDPPHLEENYSIQTVNGTGLDSMGGGTPTITINLKWEKRTTLLDSMVMMRIIVNAEIVSKQPNPATGVNDVVSFRRDNILIYDPDPRDYQRECGYNPG